MRALRIGRALAALALAALALLSLSCAVKEETTPAGFVIAPSVPADAGLIGGDGGT